MKPLLVVIALMSACSVGWPAPAPLAPAPADAKGPAAPAKVSEVSKQLQQLIAQVNAKLKAGATGEAALKDDLAGFDQLLQAHKAEKTEEVAQVLYFKAMLYVQVLKDFEQGAKHLERLKADFPATPQAKEVDAMLAELGGLREIQQLQSTLQPGQPFPDFSEKDLAGQPLSISKFKGKVVLVDFWATWCGPCVQELPAVLAAYKKYKEKGFEIVGISLDQQEFTLKSFLKNTGMSWPQYFDGKGWQNKLGQKYGISSIPATFLLDRQGKIVARDLRGPDLEAQLAKLLGP